MHIKITLKKLFLFDVCSKVVDIKLKFLVEP